MTSSTSSPTSTPCSSASCSPSHPAPPPPDPSVPSPFRLLRSFRPARTSVLTPILPSTLTLHLRTSGLFSPPFSSPLLPGGEEGPRLARYVRIWAS